MSNVISLRKFKPNSSSHYMGIDFRRLNNMTVSDTQKAMLREIDRVLMVVTLNPGRTCDSLKELLDSSKYSNKDAIKLPSKEALMWKLLFAEYIGKAKCLYGRWFVVESNDNDK